MRLSKKLILIPVIAGMLAIPLLGCSSQANSTATGNRVVTVQSGNITTAITAAGNLALSQTQDLPINLFYQGGTAGRGGTVGRVLVEVGDTVKKGQVLVTVDPAEWADELTAMEDAVLTAESNLTQAQANLVADQQALEATKDTGTLEKAVLSAQVSLQQAQDALGTAITTTDYQAAEANLRKAQAWYEYLQRAGATTGNASDLLLAQETAKENLDAAQTAYDNTLSGYDTQDVNLKKKQVGIAELTLTSAQKALADAPDDIAQQETQVTLAAGSVAKYQKALADAQKNLTKAQGMSPEVTAPFDGFITAVNVKAGDSVFNGTIAVTLADPAKFEADIVVNEMDIARVKLGGDAQVSINALSGLNFPAKVTWISPTATVQSGVVNYSVRVELQSPEAAAPSANFTPTAGFPSRAGQGRSGQAAPENYQPRDGMNVTVNIIVAQKTNVLVVPIAAITSQGGNSYVEVMLPAGTTEKRAIETGATDYTNTEVTSGLKEGEQVMVPQGTATQPASSTPRAGGGGILFGR